MQILKIVTRSAFENQHGNDIIFYFCSSSCVIFMQMQMQMHTVQRLDST